MCVASGECKTSTGSNPNDSTPSKIRSPEPSTTGATSSVSSSTTPAMRAWCTVEAPPAMSTPPSPAGLARLCVSGVEAAGDEVEGRPAFHLDRLVSVTGEHKHRRVVRRLGTPPAAPVLIPLAADRPEHVPPHDVGAAWAHEPAGRRRVGVVGALVAEMPSVELAPAFAEWILAALVGPSDETVERDRHVAGGVRHRRPLGLVCDLQVATAPLEPPPSHRTVKPPGPATPGFRASEHPPLGIAMCLFTHVA